MNFPEELYYTKDHEWVRIEGNVGTIGVTDFAQSELGDIVYVEVDTLDDAVEAEGVFGTIEAVKTVSELFMPVAGTVIEFNEELEDRPELVNEDAYGDGWIIKANIDDLTELDSLLSSEEYSKMVGH